MEIKRDKFGCQFIKKMNVKMKLQGLKCRVGETFYSKLDEVVEREIVQAVERTGKNGRKTVMDKDL